MPVSKTPIRDQLDALYPDRSDKRRAGHKAAALAEKLGTRSFQITGCVGDRTVTVSGIHVDSAGRVVCQVSHPDLPAAYPDGTPVNPFMFGNPPIRHDGVEDPVAAARQMVRDAFAVALARFG